METRRELTTTEYAVLGLLAFGESSGYDLVREASRSIDYMWAPSRSQIYKVLPRLVGWGLAESREVEQQGRPDKALYRITDAGLAQLRSWIETEEDDPAGGPAVFLMKLFFGWVAPPDAARTQLALYRRLVAKHLAEFEEMERGLPERGEPAHSRVALRHGILRARATLDWADEAASMLESVAAEEALDQGARGRTGGD
jgi:DNA-binding PadR family transcriptional regulator